MKYSSREFWDPRALAVEYNLHVWFMLLNVPLLECKVVGPKRTITAPFWPFLTKFICRLCCADICLELKTFQSCQVTES